MAKRIDPAPWPWLDRPRVLLENPDRDAALAAVDVLRHAGYAVAVCPGPDDAADCPVACGDGCSLVEGADVVVTSLGLDREPGREVLAGLRSRYPGRRLVVESRAGDLSTEQLLDAVRGAILQ